MPLKNKGYIKISRKLFSHKLWKEKRSFSKFEAWLDIIRTASFKDGQKGDFGFGEVKWGRGQMPVSINYLCNRWGWKPRKVRLFLQYLMNEKMIVKITTYQRAGWATTLTVCKYDDYNVQGQVEGQVEGQESNKGILINDTKYIVGFLNSRANKSFKHTTESTKSHISARLNDGYTKEDFEKVIDVKCKEWLNTDMAKHLNPETLFRPSNFEKYLNQAPSEEPKPQPGIR